MKTLLVHTVDQWRDRLKEHHASESGVWLVFHQLYIGVASVEYKDALDEALCFGWVDGLVKRSDDRRYARRFTPQRRLADDRRRPRRPLNESLKLTSDLRSAAAAPPQPSGSLAA
jgi:uncharacterized protein YdeI (YjbR/CyaY-like superfamily)